MGLASVWHLGPVGRGALWLSEGHDADMRRLEGGPRRPRTPCGLSRCPFTSPVVAPPPRALKPFHGRRGNGVTALRRCGRS